METLVIVCESEKLGRVFFVPGHGTRMIFCCTKEAWIEQIDKYAPLPPDTDFELDTDFEEV